VWLLRDKSFMVSSAKLVHEFFVRVMELNLPATDFINFVRENMMVGWLRRSWPGSFLKPKGYSPGKSFRAQRTHRRLNRVICEADGLQHQQLVLELVRSFEPRRAIGIAKVRLGGPCDGAYIMLDDFKDVAGALSMGVGPDVQWDIAIAERGLKVHEFDHTVTAPPSQHPLVKFRPL
jgi:hypothetical protein